MTLLSEILSKQENDLVRRLEKVRSQITSIHSRTPNSGAISSLSKEFRSLEKDIAAKKIEVEKQREIEKNQPSEPAQTEVPVRPETREIETPVESNSKFNKGDSLLFPIIATVGLVGGVLFLTRKKKRK